MQTDFEERLKHYLNELPNKVGKYNAGLLTVFTQKYKALPSAPGASRINTTLTRLCTVSKFLNNKPLDKLTETDIQSLNIIMADKKMKSAQDYRKVLKVFFKLWDKKGFYELIESDYLKAPRKKANAEKRVRPETFWSNEEVERFLAESNRHSLKSACWGGLWLSIAARPHELFALRKQSIVWKEPSTLIVKVPKETKTGERSIVLTGNEALGCWNYCKDYLKTLPDNALLFEESYQARIKLHKKLCKLAKIGKEKDLRLYVARRMGVTKFYSQHGLVRGAMLSGHQPGGGTQKFYVGLTEQQLEKPDFARVESKPCPSCGIVNPTHASNCFKCQSPLNVQAFQSLLAANLKEMVKLEVENHLYKKAIK